MELPQTVMIRETHTHTRLQEGPVLPPSSSIIDSAAKVDHQKSTN